MGRAIWDTARAFVRPALSQYDARAICAHAPRSEEADSTGLVYRVNTQRDGHAEFAGLFDERLRHASRSLATGPAPGDHDALSEEESEMTERISLEGKVAVVTGAGRGLGRAYVELLAERGVSVVVNDLGTDVSGLGKDSTIAEQVADLIRSRGGEAIANDSDVSTPEGGRDLSATTIEHFGKIDLLVNNDGICGSQLFEDATLDDFEHYWRVHL